MDIDYSKYLENKGQSYSFLPSGTCLQFWLSRLFGKYIFSREDRLLFENEKTWKIPEITLIRQDNNFNLLDINGRPFFWPKNMEHEDLSWLYAEIFYPWNINPSSYSHPDIRLGQLEWVLDAGAFEGFFSLLALESGTRTTLVVEPLREVKESLEKNLDKTAALRQAKLELLKTEKYRSPLFWSAFVMYGE